MQNHLNDIALWLAFYKYSKRSQTKGVVSGLDQFPRTFVSPIIEKRKATILHPMKS